MIKEMLLRTSKKVYTVESMNEKGMTEILFEGTAAGYKEFLNTCEPKYGCLPKKVEYTKIKKRRTLADVVALFREDGEVKVRKDLLDRLLTKAELTAEQVTTIPDGPFYMVRMAN